MAAFQNSALEVVKNSHHFDSLEDKSRIEIFQGIIPKTKGIPAYEIVVDTEDAQYLDPLKAPTIPSERDLDRWAVEISKGGYVRYNDRGELVLFDINTINLSKKLHHLRYTQNLVEREISFFYPLKLPPDPSVNP